MGKKPRWEERDIKNGIMEVRFFSWKYFHDYIRQEMLNYSHYVWRGQREATWKLESSLDRILKIKRKVDRPRLAKNHLDSFKLSTRGRRGANPPKLDSDNDWWSLGQHHGLATPLLDWSESPFVALYFAFQERSRPSSGSRSVWALSPVDEKNQSIKSGHNEHARPPILEWIRPAQDENYRLVSQGGLFTRTPIGVTVDEWIAQHYAGEEDGATLLKLVIPDKDRFDCLRTLNRMNINHNSLFPDLYGSSEYCNAALEVTGY